MATKVESKDKASKQGKTAIEAIAKNWLALVVGLTAIVIYLVMTKSMSNKIGLAETDWTRLVFLYNGIQALAFGAAGYLFGEKVNRERADGAEVRAEGAEAAARDDHGKAEAAKLGVATLAANIRA